MTYAAMQNFIAWVQRRGRVIRLGYARAFALLAGCLAAAFRSLADAWALRGLRRCLVNARHSAFAVRARYLWLQRGAGGVFAQARAKQARHACCRLNKAPPRLHRVSV